MKAVHQAFSYRSDPLVPSFPDDRPILIFDGTCALCSGFARLILRQDRARCFRFMMAQTPTGAALYSDFGFNPDETNILLDDGRPFLKSEAALRVFLQVGLPWSLAGVGWLLPRSMRDRLYDVVARNRLAWFGTRDVCYAPGPSQADRFIA
jgi:predicted DCC family thiol-disulfide oxidoreductase YuxK